MDAKDYLSGVFLDTHMFDKNSVINMMEDYYNYRVEQNKQVEKKFGSVVLENPEEIKNCIQPTESFIYWKCINSCDKFTKNKIYKLIGVLEDLSCFIDDDGNSSSLSSKNRNPSTEQEYLLQISKEKYPVGVKFKPVHCPDIINTVKSHDCHKNTFVYNDGLSINFLTEEVESFDGNYCNNASVYYNDKWAEVLKPILETEDGVELYEDDSYWFCGINGNKWEDESISVNYKPYFEQSCIEGEFSNTCKFFSTKKACQEYIDKHKEKTLEDYEELLYTITEGLDFFSDLKTFCPELYWYKIALLIRDDLNNKDKSDFYRYFICLVPDSKSEDGYKIEKKEVNAFNFNKFKFYSNSGCETFVKVMGGKIKFLF